MFKFSIEKKSLPILYYMTIPVSCFPMNMINEYVRIFTYLKTIFANYTYVVL